MNIAVTYDNGQIFQHFGHCATFKLYQAQEGRILREEIIDASGSGHEALAGLLNDFDVDVLICGGIGGAAKVALPTAGYGILPGLS